MHCTKENLEKVRECKKFQKNKFHGSTLCRYFQIKNYFQTNNSLAGFLKKKKKNGLLKYLPTKLVKKLPAQLFNG